MLQQTQGAVPLGYGEDELRALVGQPAGAGPLDLGEPFKVLPSGVYFAPDTHAWSLLDPIERAALAPPEGLGEQVIAEGVGSHWRRVLPFPFTAQQLLRFAEYAMPPELCEWMEREAWHPPLREDAMLLALADRPQAHELALLLAGLHVADTPTAVGDLAPGVDQFERHKKGEVWTPTQRAGLLSYKKQHGTAAAAAHFGINPSRVRALLRQGPKKAPTPTANNPFGLRKGGGRGSGRV